MSKNLFSRYIWIIDTIRRHGTITREEINRLWLLSPYSDGNPLARRTFYNYRNDIEEIFKINIVCNPRTFEYSIEDADDTHTASVTDWMLNTASMSNTLTDAHDIADRVFLEDVPSAREHLSTVIGAMKDFQVLKFNYSPYSRTGAPKPVKLEPYFLKIFKLRWYVTGRNVKEDKIKTYALDRMTGVKVDSRTFTLPPDFDAEAYFRDAFGIVFSQGEPKKVIIRTDPRQAKYFRALPLHHSQSEMICDQYSTFTYHLRLTPDFVQELLSYGPKITVMAPTELRAMMISNLTESLKNYTCE
ncbi:MAG: WYL domain-containing protein [Bacteroides sp.]|nr:WYL domain-containing protein [Bacteroides sp.]MCM1413517.1 WYL domain-containing protein [Bacteroides sp.]MCM1471071.1 WYL domain-containing protein [Bacteroides sp.]